MSGIRKLVPMDLVNGEEIVLTKIMVPPIILALSSFMISL